MLPFIFNNTDVNFPDIQNLPTAGIVNATVLTPGQPLNVTGQPFQIASAVSAGNSVCHQRPGTQKLIVASQAAGGPLHHVTTGNIGQPRLIVPAQQVALISSNGGSTTTSMQNIEIKKEGNFLS